MTCVCSVAGVRTGLLRLPLRPVAPLPPALRGVRGGAGRAGAGQHQGGGGGAVPVLDCRAHFLALFDDCGFDWCHVRSHASLQLWLFHVHNFVTLRVRAEQRSQDVVASLSGAQTRDLLWPSASACPLCFNSTALTSPGPDAVLGAVAMYRSRVQPAANEAAVLSFLRLHYGSSPTTR
eukprot:CAMPEP_0170074868 /NCGR_PEP_ID=MMETSP0019_2-20121128/12112_1 /TAXON_ID=98059 /ORGANISM="Dinobryon sp., Strain UTEXLB2267" /LENGTH=177 /DNA_ID=CAMNT_0010285481 /DNA_START=364 /DNA_END=898 /DNA_ORIENTATION=-